MMYIGLSRKQTRAVSQSTTQKITAFHCPVQGRQNRPSFNTFLEDILKLLANLAIV
jgi:hypothetical protein